MEIIWATLLLMYFTSVLSNSIRERNTSTKALPDKLIIGYPTDSSCDDKIIEAVKNGVNVVIWFSISLSVSDTGEPTIINGPDWSCVADKVKEIRDLGLDTVHLISIGGWNAPHPDTSNPVAEVYKHFDRWNREEIADPTKGFFGFDGFDWDIEGNDDPNSPYNHFTVECLDFMGRFSQLAKLEGNYLVSMVPAESYLDPTMSSFDRSLLHTYPEWVEINNNFAYHGLNAYAYILAKYGFYSEKYGFLVNEKEKDKKPTFDFITIQLYESYAHAEYNTSVVGTSPINYLINYIPSVLKGWKVDFSTDKDLNFPHISDIDISKTQFVVGLANGWAGNGRCVLMYPEEVGKAYEQLVKLNLEPRGFAFWDIQDEGKASDQNPIIPVWIASGLNRFLHTRP